ncbi:hypothetical protein CC85DRAFT_75833 [Cutaneotrichosporon oleaginosum]|uniref:Uncharacterized protein n=1 Tax=Cutaneotrichosporon oleaginosum TaxID=879819 RepID=A0A0J0XP48_9TREE|nr:uncharacterized protein CC85DRAFT_75833 [Cutaneotrichosporon oleaginosum]KLT42842.1 hypothetical protein CC85DRAFT_75833 [Cutaneotrichosporon oleaginosum]TXT08192.1 hypothetical protein COLE_05116 [Cutaneotrichosporon oleaginosum]
MTRSKTSAHRSYTVLRIEPCVQRHVPTRVHTAVHASTHAPGFRPSLSAHNTHCSTPAAHPSVRTRRPSDARLTATPRAPEFGELHTQHIRMYARASFTFARPTTPSPTSASLSPSPPSSPHSLIVLCVRAHSITHDSCCQQCLRDVNRSY